MDSPSAKAQVLADALPHLKSLRNTLMVIKYGGSVIEEAVYADSILTDLGLLQQFGASVVLVHGGGKAISAKMREAAIQPKFVNGLRFTDRKTISIVDSVLTKSINPQIVQSLQERGTKATTLSGKKVFTAKKIYSVSPQGERVSLGFVGDITKVSKTPILNLVKKGVIPVITPLAMSGGGDPLNVNADLAAARLAAEIKATHLTFLSDVNGILEDAQHPDSVIPQVSETEIQSLRHAGVISGGMLPKVNASIDALKSGVKRVKMLNGQLAHCILIDLFFNSRLGTEVVLS